MEPEQEEAVTLLGSLEQNPPLLMTTSYAIPMAAMISLLPERGKSVSGGEWLHFDHILTISGKSIFWEV